MVQRSQTVTGSFETTHYGVSPTMDKSIFLPWKFACYTAGASSNARHPSKLTATCGTPAVLSSGSRVKQHAVFEGCNAHGKSTDSPTAVGFKVL